MLFVSITWLAIFQQSNSVFMALATFTVDHAFSYPHGDYPIIHYNEIRDITSILFQLMSNAALM